MPCVAASAGGRNSYFLVAAWVAVDVSDTPAVVAILLGAGSIGELLTTNVGGSLVDRFDRRLTCIVCDLLRLVTTTATGIGLSVCDPVSVLLVSWITYSIIDRTYLTSLQALIPSLAQAERLMALNSFAYIVMQCGNLIAALAVGVLLTSVTPQLCFLLPIGCFALSFFLMTAFRFSRLEPKLEEQRKSHRFTRSQALPTLLQVEPLRTSGVVYALIYTMGMLISVLVSAFVLQELEGPALQFGYLEAAWALGSVAGCTLFLVRSGNVARRGIVCYLAMSGVALSGFLISQNFLVAFIQMMILGVSYNAARVLIDVETQLAVPASHLGRTRSQIHTVCVATGLLAYGLIALFGDRALPSTIFGGFGIVMVCTACCLLRRSSRRGGRSVDRLNEI